MKQQSIQKAYKVFVMILLAGIICHGLGIIIADLLFPYESLSIVADPSKVHLRLDILNYTYYGCMTCAVIFFLGMIDLLRRCNQSSVIPSPKKLVTSGLILIALLLGCTGILALLDWDNCLNFFFPLWSILPAIGIFLVISLVLWLIKRV